MSCSKLSSELEVVNTHEVGLSMGSTEGTTRYCNKVAHGKGDERKPHAMQCVRENHSGPDEEHSTDSRRKVTAQFQF